MNIKLLKNHIINMEYIVNKIIKYIDGKESRGVSIELHKIPLDKLHKSDIDALLFYLLNYCFEKDNKNATRCIIDVFNEARVSLDPLPAITNIFLNAYFEIDLIKYVIACFPEKEASGYYLDLINLGNDADALKIAKQLFIVFPNLIKEEWLQLYKLTDNFEEEEYENTLLREFFRERTIDIKQPTWIIAANDGKIEFYPDDFPSVDEAIKLIKYGFSEYVDSDNKEDMESILTTQYAISTSLEKIVMLSEVKKIESFDDKILFQRYGPCNTMPGEDNCKKYGGCRMLLCSDFEEREDVFLINDKICWFTGICKRCDNKIPRKHHAVRNPLLNGGWKDCYCSFECLEKCIDNNLTALMVGKIKEQMKVIGICDR